MRDKRSQHDSNRQERDFQRVIGCRSSTSMTARRSAVRNDSNRIQIMLCAALALRAAACRPASA